MPITPSELAENTWEIKVCVKANGTLRCINEKFVGSIKDAMLREKQLKGLATDQGADSNPS